MKLEEVFDQPGEAWLVMERLVNDGSPSGARTTTSGETSPQGAGLPFRLPFYACEGIATVAAHPGLPGLQLPEGFPVHPDLDPATEGGLGGDAAVVGTVSVVPTSSGRTVAVIDPSASEVHLKLHYPRILGRFKRKLDAQRALAAIDTTTILADPRVTLPDTLAFLPEPVAFLTPTGVAAVVRSPAPHPAGKHGALVPLFSLVSSDRRRPSDPTLLTQLLTHEADPVGYVWSQLLCPILDGWGHLALDLGLLCEWNAQNLLVDLTDTGAVARIVFRDLQGTHRDVVRRPPWASHLESTDYRTMTGADPEADGAQRSWLFDFKLGEYVLDLLVAAVSPSPEVRTDLTTALRDRFDARVGSAGIGTTDLFPKDGTTFAQPPGQLTDGRWLERRQGPPTYRSIGGSPT